MLQQQGSLPLLPSCRLYMQLGTQHWVTLTLHVMRRGSHWWPTKLACTLANLKEEAGIEALDGCFTAVPFAQMHLTIASTAQKLHQRDVSRVNDLHCAGNALQAELVLCRSNMGGRVC